MAKRKPSTPPPPKPRKKPAPRRKPAARPKPARRRAKSPSPLPPAEAPPFAADDPGQSAHAYERHKDRTARRQRQLAVEGAEIGPLPDVGDPDRKAGCRLNLQLYLETYHPETFRNPWSQAQLDLIARCERAIRHGGLCAVAYPRGEGKSSIVECALLWAILYGHHRYVFILKATDDKFAEESLESIKAELESNDRLLADFPEVCYPIACLEGIAQRANKQTLGGQRTHIGWKGKKRIVLPAVDGSAASGAVIGGAGLTARGIRGSRFKRRVDGQTETLRPSLVVADDVQDDESAASREQTLKIKRLMNGAVLGMAGPDGHLAVLFPCTIIEPGDLADELTDREKSPEWKGLRLPLLLRWPDRFDLWEEWSERRRTELKGNADLDDDASDPTPQATQFLRDHYDALHAGAEIINPHRKLAWQVSALHQAMTLYFRDPLSFWSEQQNWIETPGCPTPPNAIADLRLDADKLAVKCSGYPRGCCPAEVRWITSFVDVHDRALVWMVCGWEADFTGYILDYGTFPETRRAHWSIGAFQPTLRERFAGESLEGAITRGLFELQQQLLARDFTRDDGATLQVSLGLIDTGYQSAAIRRWLRSTPLRSRLRPSFGRTCGPNDVPIADYRARAGEQLGEDWLIRLPTKGGSPVQHVIFDTYRWKTFAARRLAAPIGDPGCVALPSGKDAEPVKHELLSRHLTAELPLPTEGRFQVDVWQLRPGEHENHWWDCFVGNCVAASILGARIGGQPQPQHRTRKTRPPIKVNLTLPDGRGFFLTDRS